MKNSYRLEGDFAVINLSFKGRSVETLIDVDDLHAAKSIKGTWLAKRDLRSGRFYVRANVRKGCESRSVSLHRLITEAPIGLVVDHINGNALDNRRHNLRVVTQAQNMQNTRPGKEDRGICFRPARNKWSAQVAFRGKQFYIGQFERKEEACKAAARARAELLPFSYEATIQREAL